MTVEVSSRPDLRDRLGAHPAGRVVLGLAWPEPVYVVGGAVRDLLLGATPVELDVVVEGDSEAYALALAASSGGQRPQALNDRFATATVLVDGRPSAQGGAVPAETRARVDVARARAERYEAPGALPTVRPAPIEEDLQRRDFTVNALALRVGPSDAGELLAARGSLADLDARLLRVLHDESFRDDPTRLLRLARYASRLSLAIEPETERLARAAVWQGALASVSGARLGAELRLGLAERDPAAPLEALAQLGVLAGLHPRLRWDPELLARARTLAGSSVGDGVRLDLLALASILLALTLRADGDPRGSEARALLDRLQFPAPERDRALGAAVASPGLIEVLEGSPAPSELRAALAEVPLEGVALAGAMSSGVERGRGYAAAQRWLSELRLVRLRIDGRDLLAAGVPEGPEIGRRLEAALRQRLDGQLPDQRQAQLAAALAAE